MGEYYFPSTKKDLLIWIKQRYFSQGQCVAGLERLPKKQLFAIFFQMRKRIDCKEFIS